MIRGRFCHGARLGGDQYLVGRLPITPTRQRHDPTEGRLKISDLRPLRPGHQLTQETRGASFTCLGNGRAHGHCSFLTVPSSHLERIASRSVKADGGVWFTCPR